MNNVVGTHSRLNALSPLAKITADKGIAEQIARFGDNGRATDTLGFAP